LRYCEAFAFKEEWKLSRGGEGKLSRNMATQLLLRTLEIYTPLTVLNGYHVHNFAGAMCQTLV
jgi:hypothetical protein